MKFHHISLKIKTFKYLSILLLVFPYTAILFLIIGYSGCKSGSLTKSIETEAKEASSKQKTSNSGSDFKDNEVSNSHVNITEEEEKSSRYPLFDEERGITYLDEYTIEYNGVKMVTNGPETKIIFPNGKELSNIKDVAIMKEVPKEAQVYYQSSEEDLFMKEVDLKKISKAQKTKWFGKMKLHPDIKQSDLDYMIVNSHILDLDETPGRVCLADYAEVWSEMGDLVGRIAQMDIYDYEGKLILQIPMYDYGSERFTVTKDQKYLLANVNGSNFGDGDYSCGLLSPQIRIYTFEDGKFFKQLNMPCAGWGFSGLDTFFWFAIDTYKGGIYPESSIIKIVKFSDEIRFNFDNFSNEGVITKDGKLWKFQTYTFDEWNKLYETVFKEKQD